MAYGKPYKYEQSKYDPTQVNPRGDSANGQYGSMTDGSVGNAMLQGKTKQGGNPFADMLTHAQAFNAAISPKPPQPPQFGGWSPPVMGPAPAPAPPQAPPWAPWSPPMQEGVGWFQGGMPQAPTDAAWRAMFEGQPMPPPSMPPDYGSGGQPQIEDPGYYMHPVHGWTKAPKQQIQGSPFDMAPEPDYGQPRLPTPPWAVPRTPQPSLPEKSINPPFTPTFAAAGVGGIENIDPGAEGGGGYTPHPVTPTPQQPFTPVTGGPTTSQQPFTPVTGGPTMSFPTPPPVTPTPQQPFTPETPAQPQTPLPVEQIPPGRGGPGGPTAPLPTPPPEQRRTVAPPTGVQPPLQPPAQPPVEQQPSGSRRERPATPPTAPPVTAPTAPSGTVPAPMTPTTGGPTTTAPQAPTPPTEPARPPESIRDYMRKLFEPGFDQEQSDLSRAMLQSASLTGAQNSGGYSESHGRNMSRLVANQGARLSSYTAAADLAEKQLGMQKYQIDTNKFLAEMDDATKRYGIKTNDDFQRWVNDPNNETIAKYGIDKNDLLQRYMAELGLQGAQLHANAAYSASAASAAASQMASQLNYDLGQDRLAVDREQNYGNFILGLLGYQQNNINNIIGTDPSQLLTGTIPWGDIFGGN